MRILGFILWGCLSALVVQGQPITPWKVYVAADTTQFVARLDTSKINVPANFKAQTYLALAHYPELQGTRIKLKYAKQKTSMSARPHACFLIKRRSKRRYVIRIDESLGKKQDGILLEDVPFNAQVGVIGHELAHVLDYSGKSSIGIAIVGFRYLFPSYRRKMEHYTDELTLAHGLGYQLYDWANFVFTESDCGENYRNYKQKYYYREHEIEQLMRLHEAY